MAEKARFARFSLRLFQETGWLPKPATNEFPIRGVHFAKGGLGDERFFSGGKLAYVK
jgi:hypothetical protein